MKHVLIYFALLVIFLIASSGVAMAQDWQHPIIERYGSVVAVPVAAWMPDASRAHRIVFDLASAETEDSVNVGLWYLARLRNLLALAGVPTDSIQLAGVLHGGATTLALSDAAAFAKTGHTNANLALMRDLTAAGTTFYVCGQSAASAGIDIEGELNDVTVPALSAMTTLIGLKEAGWVTP